MMIILQFGLNLLVFLSISALPDLHADQDQRLSRIVGGETARPGQFPHQVSLRKLSHHFCGGSIISANWIVSAAHCFRVRDFYAVVGAHSINSDGTRYDLVQFEVHADYNSRKMENDIAMARTAKAIIFTKTVQPISIGSGKFVDGGIDAVASGWGLLKHHGSLATKLQFLEFETISNENCSRWIGIEIKPSILCIHTAQPAKGVCNGDSGGPLISNGTLIGICSWGIEGCAAGYPDGFTRVSSFVPWINERLY